MIRIRAKAVQPPRSALEGYPAINGILPTWSDVQLFVVAEDGTEVPLTGVKSIKLETKQGLEPITATLECYVDEIDVLAQTDK